MVYPQYTLLLEWQEHVILQLQLSVLSCWLKNEIPNHSKAKVPPNPLRSSSAASANNPSSHPGFQSCWTTAEASMSGWLIQLLFSFWESLRHHLRISLNDFTWVGSFTGLYPQPDKIDPLCSALYLSQLWFFQDLWARWHNYVLYETMSSWEEGSYLIYLSSLSTYPCAWNTLVDQ